jgi:hypothetical protein
MFNTAFIQNGNYIKCGKMELSPEDIRKDKGKIISNDFKIYIFFDDFCTKCSPYKTEIEDLCQMCKDEIGPETLQQWRDVKEICDNHDFPDMQKGKELLPNVDGDDLRETLEKNLQFNPDYYRITNVTFPGDEEKLSQEKS